MKVVNKTLHRTMAFIKLYTFTTTQYNCPLLEAKVNLTTHLCIKTQFFFWLLPLLMYLVTSQIDLSLTMPIT